MFDLACFIANFQMMCYKNRTNKITSAIFLSFTEDSMEKSDLYALCTVCIYLILAFKYIFLFILSKI